MATKNLTHPVKNYGGFFSALRMTQVFICCGTCRYFVGRDDSLIYTPRGHKDSGLRAGAPRGLVRFSSFYPAWLMVMAVILSQFTSICRNMGVQILPVRS